MTPAISPSANAVGRDAILDVAERLIRTKGYERMSIQEVQDELGISRGAVYHYFRSKEVLLEAVAERMADTVMGALLPVVADPSVPADQKLQSVFRVAGRWKTERRDLVLGLLEVWLSDANAVARAKLRRLGRARVLPLLVDIVQQGSAEGIFTVTSAEHASRVLWSLLDSAAETALELYVAHRMAAVSRTEVRRSIGAYEEAVERILGLPSGSFTYIDDHILGVWFP